jgi:hypothetical protein
LKYQRTLDEAAGINYGSESSDLSISFSVKAFYLLSKAFKKIDTFKTVILKYCEFSDYQAKEITVNPE